MRPARLAVLTAAAALLGACSSSGIQSQGGDVFVLETSNLSGSRAVERGLADARDFCVANGRQLIVQDSRIGSGSYQLQFRCVAPFGTARTGGVDPLLAAAATPVAPAVAETPVPRRRRVHRSTTADAQAVEPAEAPRQVRRARRARQDDAAYAPADGAALQPIPQPTLPARFARPEPAPQEPPALPPVSTTPLFNPRGASFPAPVPAPVRSIPADSGPFAPVAPPAGQPAAAVQPAAAPRPAPSDALPPIQLPPAAVSSGPAAPASSYGASVPSPQALPTASSALAPIASPVRPIPAATPAASLNTPPPGFFTAPGR